MESVTVSVSVIFIFFGAWAQSASQSTSECTLFSSSSSPSIFFFIIVEKFVSVRLHAKHLYGFQFTDISFNLSIIARIYQKIYIVSRKISNGHPSMVWNTVDLAVTLTVRAHTLCIRAHIFTRNIFNETFNARLGIYAFLYGWSLLSPLFWET